VHFETYEPFISLIFQFFLWEGGCCGRLQITETAGTESVDMGAHLYIYTEGSKKMYTHFKKGKNFIKIVMVFCSSNDNGASAIFFDYPACRMKAIF
jgi:hypothetical protein